MKAVERLEGDLRGFAAIYLLVAFGEPGFDIGKKILVEDFEERLKRLSQADPAKYDELESKAFDQSFQTLRHIHREVFRDEIYNAISRPAEVTFGEFWNVAVKSFYERPLRKLLQRDDELETIMEVWEYGCSDFIFMEEYEVSCRIPQIGTAAGKHVLQEGLSLTLEDIESRPHLQQLSLKGCFSKKAAKQAMRECAAIIRACGSAQYNLIDNMFGKPVGVDQTHVLPLCKRMIEYYYDHQPALESQSKLARRIWNAIDLLMRSVSQPPAIEVGLCVAGIEAILSDSTLGATDAVARRFSTMQESDKHYRRDAIRFMKNLYSQRSSAFHGSSLAATHQCAREARCALVATIESAIAFRDFQSRVGDENKSDDLQNFIDELESASVTASEVPGCIYDRVASVWRHRAPKK